MERDDTLWLTGLEYDVLTCARETWGILPYLVEHKRPDGEWPSAAEATAAVLSMVERGWVVLHRLEPWTSPDGQHGTQYGDPIDPAALPSLLADPDTWDDPADERWIGELTLSLTREWSSSRAGRPYGPLPTWTTH